MIRIRAGYFDVFTAAPTQELTRVCREHVQGKSPPPPQLPQPTQIVVNQHTFRMDACEWDASDGIFTGTMWRVRTSNLPSALKDGAAHQVDSDLGESASFALRPADRKALIQYANHGPRHTHLSQFIEAIGLVGMTALYPVVQERVLARMNQARQVKKIEYVLRPKEGRVQEMRNVGGAVGSSIETMLAVGGARIKVEVSAERGRENALAATAKGLLNGLLLLDASVESVKATIRESERDSPRLLDLLKGRQIVDLSIAESGRELDRADCRARLKASLKDNSTTSDEEGDDDVDDEDGDEVGPAPTI